MKRIAAAMLGIFVVLLTGCRPAIQASSSMAPTIMPGERVTVDYSAYAVTSPKRWDVIAFRPPVHSNAVFVMRVVGMPGETVAFATGSITVNGRPLSLPMKLTNVTYLVIDRLPHAALFMSTNSPYVVPQKSYFVLGDNSANANDSRYWGAVPEMNIVGRVRNK